MVWQLMPKIDLKKDLKELYTASPKEVALVNAPRLHFLMLDGAGDPNAAPEFQQATETLFSVSYALKFMVKKAKALDYGVMPLEGLWWAEDLAAFVSGDKDKWQWTLMILQPECVTPELVNNAITEVRKKKNPPLLDQLRFSAWCEGEAAQVLHVGPFAEEHLTMARLHAFIKDKGYHLCGKHHEIYLGDPRRTAPEKLKTILRQPITLEAMK
jgi:hypothetical protein